MSITALVSIALTAATTGASHSPAPSQTTPVSKTFAVVFDPAEHEPSVGRALDGYLTLVKATYGWEALMVKAGSRTSPHAIRELIKSAWIDRKIEGVFLVGRQSMIKFEAGIKDFCPCPEYYTDLDASFSDTSQDGILDKYLPWSHGDDSPHEVWLARVMPDTVTRDGLSPDAQLTSYFSKLSNWIRSNPAQIGSTVIMSSKDWPGRIPEATEIKATFGSSPIAYAAQTTPQISSTDGIHSSPDLLFKALGTRSDFTYISVHGGGVDWVCDKPFRDANVVATRSGGRFFAADTFRVNASVLASFSCHYLNLDGEKSTLAASVVLHPQNRCFLTFGSSRSIGLEDLPRFITGLRAQTPQEAWKTYLNTLSSKSYLERWLGVRGAWEKEKDRFVWGYYWYGAPFGPFEIGLKK